MIYRGFEISFCSDSGIERSDHETGKDVICEGYYCQVYPVGDEEYAYQIDDFCLAEGHEIKDCSYEKQEKGIMQYIDEGYYSLCKEARRILEEAGEPGISMEL